MTSVNVKQMSFEELEKDPEKGPVWVFNGTQQGSDNQRRQLMLIVPSLQGNTADTIIIPRTFIPINLTEQVSKKQLVQSSDFRKAVARGLLILTDEETAKTILGRRDSIIEKERLKMEAMKSRELLNANNMAVVAEGEGTSATDNKENVQLIRDVSPAVMQVMADTKGRQQIEIKNSLQNIGTLTQKDFEYVLSNSSEQGLSKLAKWAERKIEKMNNAASEEDGTLELED